MYKQFQRGKQEVTLVIVAMLLMNGLSFWLSQSRLSAWYRDALAHTEPLDILQVQKILAQVVPLEQHSFLTSQAASYAFLILCCVILYLGYSWIRWLWGLGWLLKGVSGLLATSLLITQFGLLTHLVFFSFITSLLYTLCATCILCSPSVHAYMRMMRH